MPSHWEIVFRLALGATLGGLVGLDRERLEWVAGLRTHMLVSLGSTLVMVVSAFGFADILGATGVILDPSRVAAQVVSGIGFLGAGTILFLRQEVIRGLTTAASLWCVAAIGLAVGGGLYMAAVSATGLVLVILALIKPIERRVFRRDQARQLTITTERESAPFGAIDATLASLGVSVSKVTLRRRDSADEDTIHITLMRRLPREVRAVVIERLQQLDGVRSVSV
jgi:putative Mg2+ transporter-C (MgtC) family protein